MNEIYVVYLIFDNRQLYSYQKSNNIIIISGFVTFLLILAIQSDRGPFFLKNTI